MNFPHHYDKDQAQETLKVLAENKSYQFQRTERMKYQNAYDNP